MTELGGSLLGDSEKLGDVHESENLHLRELHLPLTRLRAKPTVQSELEAGHYGSLRHSKVMRPTRASPGAILGLPRAGPAAESRMLAL